MTALFREGRLLLALLCALIACACASAPSGERSGVTINTWRALDTAPEQPWQGARTRLYTYVLIGDIPAGASADESTAKALRALASLLPEVQAGRSLRAAGNSQLMPEELMRANQYCIPAKDAGAASVDVQNYDRALASAYLSMFKLVLEANDRMAGRLAGPGPFFLAVRKPLSELATRDAQGKLVIDTTSPVLLMDMSGKQAVTMPVYVAAYQDSIRRNLTDRDTTLRPLSPAFASALVTTGEALPFISEAYAGTKKLFE
jgi:hypothetical protein